MKPAPIYCCKSNAPYSYAEVFKMLSYPQSHIENGMGSPFPIDINNGFEWKATLEKDGTPRFGWDFKDRRRGIEQGSWSSR